MDIANDDDHVEDLDHAEDDADDDHDDHDEDGEQPRQFTVEDIVAKAEEFAVSCNYDMADLFYRKALECVPDTVPIMEDYSNLLLEMQEVDRALTLLNRIIELNPDGSSIAYLNLAQLKTEQEAVECYLKGIQILKAHQAAASQQGEQDMASPQSVARQISNAYCAIAEIFMTDSCFAENAESECENSVKQAIESDTTNPEAFQVAASLRISQQRNADALEFLTQSHNLWKELDPSEKPSLQSRATTAKLYIELNQLPQAIEILDELVLENDQEIEPWHLLAICHSAGDTYAAEECLNKAIELARCEGDEILQQLECELAEIQQRNAALDEEQDDEPEDGHNDDDDDNDSTTTTTTSSS